MARRAHGEPRKPIRIAVAVGESVEGADEPIRGAFEFCGEFFHDFMTHFIAATADAWTHRSDHMERVGVELHLHTPERFFSDALGSSPPTGMNGGDGPVLCVGEKYGNAVGGLDGKQNSRLASDEGVAFRGVLALWKFLGADHVDDVRMNLAEAGGAHLAGTERAEESFSVFDYVFAAIPIGEAEVQYVFDGFLGAVRSFERACAAGNRAEPADEPRKMGEARRFEDL